MHCRALAAASCAKRSINTDVGNLTDPHHNLPPTGSLARASAAGTSSTRSTQHAAEFHASQK